MTVKLIYASPKVFENQKGDQVRGWQLVFFNQQTGETYRHFVNEENPKGFTEKQVAKISGIDLEISTNVRTFNGNAKVVLDKIVQLE